MVKFIISQNDENQRLDKFLRKYLKNASLSHIYKLIRKDVKVGGVREKPDRILKSGDEITIYISAEDEDFLRGVRDIQKSKRQFGIAYEDKNILVVNKPFGLLIHGSPSEKKNTLTNQVVGYLIEKGEYDVSERTFSPAPVNRLDRNTTGLVVFGKTGQALKDLGQMMKERNRIRKFYLTIVSGEIEGELFLKGELVKDSNTNKVSIFDWASHGKEIETIARVKSRARGFSLLEVEPVTGRTHQIRAHLAHAGYPVIGDAKYGDSRLNRKISEKYGLTTQLLHAEKLIFEDMTPRFEYMTGIEIIAPPPGEFNRIKSEIFD